MARVRTVGDLTGSVRLRGDLEDDAATDDYADAFISRAALMDFIDSAHAEAWDILVDADPDRYLRTYTATADSTGSIYVPEDFYRLRAVDVSAPGSDGYYRVDRYELGERDYYSNSETSTHTPTRYRLFGDRVQVQPDPEATTTVRLHYVPLATRLSSSAQTVEDVNGLPELTVLLALRRCKVRGEESTAEVDAEIVRQTARLKNAASTRDRGSPRYLEDPRLARRGRMRRRR